MIPPPSPKRLKQKRKKEVCASLNDYFSKSLTTESTKVKENTLTRPLPEVALDLDVIQPCVAYGTPKLSSKVDRHELPEYEDIPI